MLRLLLASLIALGSSSTIAQARRMPVPAPVASHAVFSVDQRLKADVDLPETHFELRDDGTWHYVQTLKHAIQKRASGRLTRGRLQSIRLQLALATWTVTTADVTCMAFSAQHTQYSVKGKLVWTDELCGDQILDRKSARRLARVMAIVNPLIASAR